MEVLGQQYQVVSAEVKFLVGLLFLASSCHVYFASEDRFERFQPFLLASLVYLAAIVEELLDAEHVAMVGQGHSLHAVLDRFVYHAAYGGLAIQKGVLRVYVQMHKIFHSIPYIVFLHKGSMFLPKYILFPPDFLLIDAVLAQKWNQLLVDMKKKNTFALK